MVLVFNQSYLIEYFIMSIDTLLVNLLKFELMNNLSKVHFFLDNCSFLLCLSLLKTHGKILPVIIPLINVIGN